MSSERLSAIVLAGTHHWSGSGFERLAPRPLVPIALAPLISYPLRWLRRGGVTEATICANGTTPAIAAALAADSFDLDIAYYQDATPRGAAGCVRDAGARTSADTLVVVDGTAIPTADLAEILEAHRSSGAAVTAVVQRECSTVGPPSPAGVYVFERRVLEHVPATGFQDIKENLIPRLRHAQERVLAYESDGCCPHVFDAQTYLAVSQWVLQRLLREGGPAMLVHPTARVDPSARLVGPVQVGAGAQVEAGATIVGPTTIGEQSTVGRNALVARSVMWDRCWLGDGALVHGSVVGHDTVVPPGARLFNVVRSPQTVLRAPLSRRRTPRAAPAPGAVLAGDRRADGLSISVHLG